MACLQGLIARKPPRAYARDTRVVDSFCMSLNRKPYSWASNWFPIERDHFRKVCDDSRSRQFRILSMKPTKSVKVSVCGNIFSRVDLPPPASASRKSLYRVRRSWSAPETSSQDFSSSIRNSGESCYDQGRHALVASPHGVGSGSSVGRPLRLGSSGVSNSNTSSDGRSPDG